MITLSVIKADIGGNVRHSESHPDVVAKAHECLTRAKKDGVLVDCQVTRCGDDLQLIMTHQKRTGNYKIQKPLWDTFGAKTEVAKVLELYSTGQDLPSDAFSGNVKGMGTVVAKMEIDGRQAEAIVIFMADKTAAKAWKLPFYKMFADPFDTIGLVISANMEDAFLFEVLEVRKSKRIILSAPEEIFDMLVSPGSPGCHAAKSLSRFKTGKIAAISSTQRLLFMADNYAGKDDPVCSVHSQSEFPTAGEISEPFPRSSFAKDVLIIHGRNSGAMETVARFIEHLSLHPIILAEQPNRGLAIVEKLERYSDVGFAVVLLTPDDFGYEAGSPENLKPRARQNPIFEWGYLMAKLGRHRVCALYWEGVEIPSDVSGLLYVKFDEHGAWRLKLARELMAAGLPVDFGKVLQPS